MRSGEYLVIFIFTASMQQNKERLIGLLIKLKPAIYILFEKNISENEGLELLIEILIRELTALKIELRDI